VLSTPGKQVQKPAGGGVPCDERNGSQELARLSKQPVHSGLVKVKNDLSKKQLYQKIRGYSADPKNNQKNRKSCRSKILTISVTQRR